MILDNIFFGIGKAASTHFVFGVRLAKKKGKFFKFTVLRTQGNISSSDNAAKAANVNFFLKAKLLAACYLNCVNLPLVDLPDDAKIIEVLAPMELYLLNGNTIRVCNNLEIHLVHGSPWKPLYHQSSGSKV